MALATASSPANRKPGDNAQTATPPQAQARPRQSSGKARAPQRAPGPRVCKSPARTRPRQRAPGPRACQTPPAHARAPSARRAPNTRQDLRSTCQNPRRAPGPPRAPGRKPGSGALAEPSSGLRGANRAEQRVPRALAGPSSELPWRRIVNFVQPWSQLTILRSITTKTHDYLRYREAHARIIDKNVRSPLPKPRKTVCFDRQRPKQTVFRIARSPGRGRGAELEGLMQTTRNQARLPLHVGTVNRA